MKGRLYISVLLSVSLSQLSACLSMAGQMSQLDGYYSYGVRLSVCLYIYPFLCLFV